MAKAGFAIYIFPWGSPRPSFGDLSNLAHYADAFGMDVHIPYHVVLPSKRVAMWQNHYVLDPMTVMAALAGSTRRAKLGITGVIGPLLHPYFWAKSFATLDVVSGGRIIFGVSAGWWEDEFRILGVGESFRKRGAITDEQVEIIRRLWTEESVNHKGQFYQLNDVRCEPKPVQRPHPPIWICGGHSGHFLASIKRAARDGDLWMPLYPTVEEAGSTHLRLEGECKKFGKQAKMGVFTFASIARELGTLERRYMGGLTKELGSQMVPAKERERIESVCILGTADQCIRKIDDFIEAGVSYFVLDFQLHGGASSNYALEQMTIFAEEVMPSF